jgi:hypothetical protein
VPFRVIRFDGHRRAAGRDAVLEELLALGFRRVTAKPVASSRQFPRRLEVAGILFQSLGPDGRGTPCAGRSSRAA